MTTDSDLILSAIASGVGDRAGLAEQTGLEAKTISNRLFALHKKGEVVKGENGWEIAGSAPARPTVHEAAAPDEALKPRAGKRQPKAAKPRAKRSPPPAPSVPQANGRECEFAIAESGAILFKVTAGPRAGELGAIGCADALALFRLMSAVEFIAENA